MASKWRVERSEAFKRALNTEYRQRFDAKKNPSQFGLSAIDAEARWVAINAFFDVFEVLEASERPQRLLKRRAKDFNMPDGMQVLVQKGFVGIFGIDLQNKVCTAKYLIIDGREVIAPADEPDAVAAIRASNGEAK
jgi:hypothetical protein